jgi:hypothetical protein
LPDDDIFTKVKYDRDLYFDNKARFITFIKKNIKYLQAIMGIGDFVIDDSLYHWAWMNLYTRCFGAYRLPSDITMVPLMDLLNHDSCDSMLSFYLQPTT